MKNLKVTLIQSDLHWRSIDANLASFEEKIWQIEQHGDLIVLPEMFTTGFTMEPGDLAEPVNGKTYKWMKQMAAQTKSAVMGSAIINDGGAFFNRLLIAYPDGKVHAYDKKHLFTLAGEEEHFSAGSERILFEVNGWKILPQVCYDLRFPIWSRSRRTDNNPFEYDVVVYCANWPNARVNSWDSLLKARAIENSAYAIGVNRVGVDGYKKDYSGHSAGYNYLGETLAYAENEEAILSFELDINSLHSYRERFPFQLDSDDFTLV